MNSCNVLEVFFIASSTVYFLQDVVIWLLYGETDAHTTIAFFLDGFLIALPLHMMIGYFTISLYSAKDTKSVFYSNFVSALCAVGVCYSTQHLGNISLVYGVVTMSVVNFTALFFAYTSKNFIKLH
jgi:hypothetical protein